MNQNSKEMRTYRKPTTNFYKLANNDIFKLTPRQFQLFAYYVMKTGNRSNCWPSNETTTKDLKWSNATVKRIKKQLLDLKFIRIESRYHNNKQLSSYITPLYEKEQLINIVMEPLLRYENTI